MMLDMATNLYKDGDYSSGVQTTGGFVTKKFYWGDFSAEPWKFERNTTYGVLKPTYYINVKVNLIDCGEPYLDPTDPNWCEPNKFGPPYHGNWVQTDY